ncbi:MAG: glutamine synthetase type III [Chitinivibrionales bacterium]|nr:glutamine synthetase type III [Chitinivibrionales bacterium]MBD3397001.1 glutamine synthetase type III [Chitinivibrionales bacterium]
MIQPVELTKVTTPQKVSKYFGANTFDDATMKRVLPKATFAAFKRWQEGGPVISSRQADEIAEAMKNWATSRGATAYTHWFQPMTGQTAEKHDSFIHFSKNGKAVERFTGSKLIQGEPDASSFPSGGLRATFEARGYTAWDPSSPAFITETDQGKTLCIPSIFISYRGDALDKKLPLLRSDAAISASARALLALFGMKDICWVRSECGPEQEYFLIDQSYAKLRSDIQLTGRTLIGAPSPKGQQLEDQYFGSIKERMLNYMCDVAEESYKLGIPLTTRHNEVAPHQYEFAPRYERSNLAADHNQLLMDVMKKVAKRHGLECLLHEKPFAGINGSGKHLNWSLSDNNGNNLLNPGETPEENLLFLTVLVCVIDAVARHADLLRASVATAGNEHRLGANEAPPAIVSVFLGEQLTKILENVAKGKKGAVSRKDVVDLGISHLPLFSRDTTDRNRTSPFAFTGQKFEFRALGSSANISTPIMVMNTIVAESFDRMTQRLAKAVNGKRASTQAVFRVLGEVIREVRPVLFEGDNYSAAWEKEARTRRLRNEPSSAKALKAFIAPKNITLFEKYKVFSSAELHARYNIWIDIYNKVIDIEARTLLEMVGTQVLPAAYEFQTSIGHSLDVLRTIATEDVEQVETRAVDDRREMFAHISSDIYHIRAHLKRLAAMIEKSEVMDEAKRADYFFSDIKEQMDEIRRRVDDLETMMPDDMWSLPKYREMLFIA